MTIFIAYVRRSDGTPVAMTYGSEDDITAWCSVHKSEDATAAMFPAAEGVDAQRAMEDPDYFASIFPQA